ncbi:MAG: tRNA pseudouridine(38-40) synthase TruA [Chloroflexi bacterium]|nr:tRNA pseudouridine(38-40) synthase TruA [Chloroflexota bacterium]
MRYFRATVEYDGTDFFGFQVQPDVPTIQGALEEALERVTTASTRVVAAGRTDTGVHARGQVIAFHSPWPREPEELWRALNAVLPESIALQDLEEVDEDFHPRYSARSREYRYFIHQRPVRSPLRLRYSLHVSHPLDEAALAAVASLIVGAHDFATFGDPTSGESTVREVFTSRWERHGEEWVYIIEANGFLRRMVRTLVMAQLWVGEGRWTPEDFEAALAAHDRSMSPPPAEPRGLHLWRVRY